MTSLTYLAILPVFILCWYINKKDPHKEPFKRLKKVFLFGILSIIPIVILEAILEKFFPIEDSSLPFIQLFINVFITVAISEEGFKWLIAYFFVIKSEEYDEIYDSIVYAVFASLGFACLENILYVLNGGFSIALSRAIFSIPGHASFGVLMGYFFAKSKMIENDNKNKSKTYLFLSFLIPAIFHTIYDALLFYGEDITIFIFFVFDIFMVILCICLIRKISKLQLNITTNHYNYNASNYNNLNSINYCPQCGENISKCNFCPKCGYKKM